MANCFMCDLEIVRENASREHVILNSIGGRLKDSGILCKSCNSKLGTDSDAELARQLNFYAHTLMIERENGETQPVVMTRPSSGESYRIDKYGKPSLKDPKIDIKKNGNELFVNIVARDQKEFDQIIAGLKRKYPEADWEDLRGKTVYHEEQLNEQLHINLVVGGKLALQSVLKSAVDYYFHCGHSREYVLSAIEALKNGTEGFVEPVVLEERIYDLVDHEVSHCIYLVGDSRRKILFCYIEFFNVVSFFVKLNDDYEGPDISDSYVFDVLKIEELQKTFRALSEEFNLRTYKYSDSKPNFERMRLNAERLMEISLKRRNDIAIEVIVKRAWDETINVDIPEGGIITEAATQKFNNRFAELLRPYLMEQFNRNVPHRDFS